MSAQKKNPGTKSAKSAKSVNPENPSRKIEEVKKILYAELLRSGGVLQEILSKIPEKLGIRRADAILMHEEIDAGSRIQSLPYWMFIVSSCGIATMGLITNSPAVIIGAMLVSPLMAPIIGLGMSVAISDIYLGMKAIMNLALSVVVAVLTSALITLFVPLNEITPEILARTSPTFLDLFIALFCGLVAVLSSVRSGEKSVLESVAPGAAIGVALMPPLCVAGYAIGSGFNWSMMWGAILLFITNLASIVMVASVFYYFIYDEYNIEKLVRLLYNKRMKTEQFFQKLSLFPLWEEINSVQTSRKRFLFPLILLLLISYPLMSSLSFLKQKNDIREFIKQELSSIGGINLIRGPEGINFTREMVGGTIIYSSEETPQPNFSRNLNEQIEKKFDGFHADIALVRMARETDLSKLQKITREINLETAPHLLQDAIRSRHAAELVDRALGIVTVRFPREAGIVLDVLLEFSNIGMERLTIIYAGKKLSPEASAILTETLANSLRDLKADVKNVELIRQIPLEGKLGCSEIEEGKIPEAMRSILSRITRNHFLKVEISAKDSAKTVIAPFKTENIKNERIRWNILTTGRCKIEYKYF